METYACDSNRVGPVEINSDELSGSAPSAVKLGPTIVRDIRQTNVGIREQLPGSNSAPQRIMLKIGGRTKSSAGNGKSISHKRTTGPLDSSDDSLMDPGDEEEDLSPRVKVPRPPSSRPV